MTRHETIKLLNGLLKGTRPVKDVFADWPLKSFVRWVHYPLYYDNALGIPVDYEMVDHLRNTYPKFKIYVMTDTLKEIEKRLKWQVAHGRKLFVPMLRNGEPVFEEEGDGTDDGPDSSCVRMTKEEGKDDNWFSRSHYIEDVGPEFNDEDGTRMVKTNHRLFDGKYEYTGFSVAHLALHPDAYEKCVLPYVETDCNPSENANAGNVETPGHVETHCNACPAPDVASLPPEETKNEIKINMLKSEHHLDSPAQTNKENLANTSLAAIPDAEFPEYLLPRRDPARWKLTAHPHHPGLYMYEEIIPESPPAKYSVKSIGGYSDRSIDRLGNTMKRLGY